MRIGAVILTLLAIYAAGLGVLLRQSTLSPAASSAQLPEMMARNGLLSLFMKRGHYLLQTCCEHSYSDEDGTQWFEVRRADPPVEGSWRAETRFLSHPFDRALRFGFTISVPADWLPGGPAVTVVQWHAARDRHLLEGGRSPVLKLVIARDEWIVTASTDTALRSQLVDGQRTAQTRELLRSPMRPGETADWRFDVIWSADEDGLVRIYRDGVPLFTQTGPTAHRDLIAPYLKYGVYVPGWKFDDTPGSPERRIRFDAVSMEMDAFERPDEP